MKSPRIHSKSRASKCSILFHKIICSTKIGAILYTLFENFTIIKKFRVVLGAGHHQN
jgi:hypothetical protein